MTAFPRPPELLKAGFVCLTAPANVERTIVFGYNPETLSRRISATTHESMISSATMQEPQEIIAFRVVLDIVDKAEFPAEFPQALRDGIYPQLSAIEQLMYPSMLPANSLVLFLWGENRILPVQIMELQIVEQMFDPTLTPTLAEIAVTLRVLKDADLTGRDWALRFRDEHLLKMRQFAASASDGSLNPFGLQEL